MPNPIDDLLDQAEAATHDELAQGQQQGGSVDDVLNAAEQSTHAELSAQPAQGSGDVMVPGPGRSWYDKISDYPQAIVNGGTAGAAQIFRGLGLNSASDDADYADVMQKAAPENLPADAAPGAGAVTSGAELGAKLYPSVVAGALNPTLGGAVFAAPDAGNRYLDIKEAGGTPGEAVGGALAQGAVDMVAPKVAEEFTGPLSELLSQYGPAGRTLAQAATGSGTAAGFQAGSAGVSALFPSDAPGTPPGQERWRQELDSIPESMLVGGILGGVPAAAGELSNLRGVHEDAQNVQESAPIVQENTQDVHPSAPIEQSAVTDPVTGEHVTDPQLITAIAEEAAAKADNVGQDDLSSAFAAPKPEASEPLNPTIIPKEVSDREEEKAQGPQEVIPAQAQPAAEATNAAPEPAALKPDLAQEVRSLVEEMRAERQSRTKPQEPANAQENNQTIPEAVRSEEGQAGLLRDRQQAEARPGDVQDVVGRTEQKGNIPQEEVATSEPAVLGMPDESAPVSVKSTDAGPTMHEARAKAKEYLSTLRDRELPVGDGTTAKLLGAGVKKLVSGKTPNDLAAVMRLPEILAKAKHTSSAPDTKGRSQIKAFHQYESHIEVDGKPMLSSITIREMQDGRRIYDHQVLSPEKSRLGRSSGESPQGVPSSLPEATPSSVAGTQEKGKQPEQAETPAVTEKPTDSGADKPRILGHGGTPKASSVSDHLWGDKSFVKNDVKPTAANAAKGILEAADDIKKAFAPQTRGDQAKTMAGMAREHGATLARRSDIAEQALYTAKRLFDRKKAAENYAFIDRMENGERQPTEDLQHIADAMRSIMDTKRDEIRDLGKGKLEHFIEDYFPHLWKDPEKATNAFSQAAGRRPIEGRKAFLKKRSIPTFKEGIDAGLEPVSENPVDLVLLKAREMDKYLLGQRLMNEMKEKKLAVFVRAMDKAPEGFGKINDPIAQVYGPPTIEVKEHVNRARYDALQEVADKLGVKHERKANLGGSMLGYSIQGGNYIASKFASDLSVIAHEISHQLDHKFDLQNLFMKSPDKKTRVAMNKELRALADLHEYKKAYFRKAEEKMASILEAYVAAPDRFKEVAPHVWDEFHTFMDKHEELHPLRDMKQSLAAKRLSTEIPHGGLLKYGEYHAPEEVATLVNNYLSPGLRGKSGLFRAYLGVGNFLNQFQLGFSAFHLGFTSLDAAISKSAIAFKHLDAGRPLEAAKAALQIPVAPLTTMIQGSKVLREWYKPGSQGAEIAAIVDGMRAAGGRARMDTFYQTNVATNMMTAFRKGNVLGGVLRIPGAVMETLSKPIMEFIVPRQKMGVFADMARLEMAKLPEGATRDQVRAAMGKAWDSVDNRMGQLVYDNLFWNKTIKDLSMASVRSVGWNLGTLREVGGGLIDTAKAAGNAARLRRPEFTHRMAYAAALPIITGIVGAITQYLKTGQGPQETKDYFFPKTGEKDENGHDIRLNLPSYMKDIYHYGHDPVAAVTGKLHPLITTVADMLRNKDFFGKEIRNAEDPIVKQALDEATFVGKQFEPMGMRTFTEDRNAGMSTGEKAASFVGVTKAPKYLSQSKAEQLAGEVGQEKYHGEPMSPELLQSRREVLTKLRSQDPQTQKEGQKQLDGLVDKRQMTMRQAKNLVRQSHLSRLEYQVTGMSVDDAMRVWRVAEPAERTEIRDEIAGKIMRSSSIDPGEKKSLMDEIQGELKSTGKKSSQSVSR